MSVIHLTGRQWLEVARGVRTCPDPPFTFDTLDLTAEEYDELVHPAMLKRGIPVDVRPPEADPPPWDSWRRKYER